MSLAPRENNNSMRDKIGTLLLASMWTSTAPHHHTGLKTFSQVTPKMVKFHTAGWINFSYYRITHEAQAAQTLLLSKLSQPNSTSTGVGA